MVEGAATVAGAEVEGLKTNATSAASAVTSLGTAACKAEVALLPGGAETGK